ncbi:unnamed protein product [Linum tenue]|uniref:Uncharacterized protein n=2 Tax=Linum tenue TaxID=586396 RepID=A0AAV0P3J0_9ROSI|nr:unnamed protein product [Linum tenue]
MAFIANALSIFIYFTSDMNFSLTKSATAVTNFMGTAYLLALFGGFLSDTYLSRYATCLLFGVIEVFGYSLLAVQAHLPQLRPNPCQPNNTTAAQCEPANGAQSAFLLVGLYSVAIGAGGVKAALPPFGADQFDARDPKEAGRLASFFNWYFVSCTVAAAVGVTLIAWVFANHGWDLGFGICGLAVLCGVVLVLFGRPFYRIDAPEGSPYVRVAQVFVAAVRNRKLPTPKMDDVLFESVEKCVEDGSNGEILGRTDQFRFLDKAAIIKTIKDESFANPTTQNAWRLCPVTQVEETKILIRMIPIILCTLFANTCVAQQQTFTVQQSRTMDRNLLGFQVPASSIPVIPLIFMSVLASVYDRFFVPLARKFTGIPTGIRHLHRIGLGLVLSVVSMAVSAVVEAKRKRVAAQYDMVDSVLPMPYSVFWLGFQYAIAGASDLFTLVGMMEFFYSESAVGMKGLGAGITLSSLAFGFYLSSVVVRVVNEVSGGWLANNNLNRDKLDYFYWLLSGLGVVNFGAFLLCAYSYRYKKVEFVEKQNGEKDEET